MKEVIQMKLPETITARKAVDRLKSQPGILKLFIASPTMVQITYSRKKTSLQEIVKALK